MTAAATLPGPAAAPHTSLHRMVTTMRVHASNPWTILATPWLVLFAVFALNYAIWQLVKMAATGPLAPGAFTQNGGVSYVLVYMVVVAVQAMNQTFSFVVGLGATRRDYFLGTSLVFGALSLVFGAGISLLAWVERATDGWGIGGAFFAPWGLRTLPIWQLVVIYTSLLLLMFFGGSAVAALFVRWGANGIIAFFIGLALVIVATLYGITVTESWQAVGEFFTRNSAVVLAAYTLPISAAAGVLGWLLMRQATPKG